jgi:hypothetical protein
MKPIKEYIAEASIVSRKKLIGIDFDATIHKYSSGWRGGAVYDEPMDDVKDALEQLNKKYSLFILTARINKVGDKQWKAVWEWLEKYDLAQYIKKVTNIKYAAEYYIDDRAVHFDTWKSVLTKIK